MSEKANTGKEPEVKPAKAPADPFVELKAAAKKADAVRVEAIEACSQRGIGAALRVDH